MTVPPKPEPISKPLVAGSDIIACAILASSRSKTGSPSAAGTPVQTHATAPPMESFSTLTCRGDVGRYGETRGEMESFSTLTCRISVAIRHAVGGCGQRSGSSSSVRLVPHLPSIESGVGPVPLGCLSAVLSAASRLHLGESRCASSRGRRPSAPPRRADPRHACRRRPANPARAGDTTVRGGERAGEATRLHRRAERSLDGFDTHPALLGSSWLFWALLGSFRPFWLFWLFALLDCQSS